MKTSSFINFGPAKLARRGQMRVRESEHGAPLHDFGIIHAESVRLDVFARFEAVIVERGRRTGGAAAVDVSRGSLVDEALPAIAGLSLDGRASIVISTADNRALCETLGVTPDPERRAHPSFFYTATQVGMGLSVAELCAACGFDVERGPMLASSRARFEMPLLTDVSYDVRGEVRSLTRKSSRKLGQMDLLHYVLRLEDEDGRIVCETQNVWVLPRGVTA